MQDTSGAEPEVGREQIRSRVDSREHASKFDLAQAKQSAYELQPMIGCEIVPGAGLGVLPALHRDQAVE